MSYPGTVFDVRAVLVERAFCPKFPDFPDFFCAVFFSPLYFHDFFPKKYVNASGSRFSGAVKIARIARERLRIMIQNSKKEEIWRKKKKKLR